MHTRSALGIIAIVATFSGCARFASAPLTPAEDPIFSEPVDMAMPGLDDDLPEPFRLHAGDVIGLRLHSAELSEMSGLIVDATGTVHVPLVGSISVGGMTLAEAEKSLETAMREYDQVVRVAVVVAEPLGHQASVLGAVEVPGRVVLTPGTRVADIIAAVGGPIPFRAQDGADQVADIGGARLVRDGATVPVSIDRALTGDLRHNVYIRPGDHLYVPGSRGRAITVLGEVSTPSLVPYQEGIRLTQVLALAGGLASDAHRRDIRVVRGPLGSPRVYGVSLKALVNGEGRDIVLAPGDIVFVTRTGVANVRDAIGSIGPLMVTSGIFGANVGAILLTQ